MSRFLILSALALALAGCTRPDRPEPKVRVVATSVEIRRPCVDQAQDPGPPIAYADAHLRAAPDAAERYRLTAAANQQRKARLALLEPVLEACRR